jgi:DNA (cytosine-5)-methyltransferase 1
LYWTNFRLPNILSERKVKISEGKNEVKNLCAFHNFDFYSYKGEQLTNKIARNLVDYEAGKTILETALGIIKQKDIRQLTIL